MKYGLNTVLWVYPFSEKSVDLIKKVRDIGYDMVEIGITDYSENNLDAIKNSLIENDLSCALVGIPGAGESIISKDEKIQEIGVDFLKKLVDACEKIGAEVVVGPTYSSGVFTELIDPENKKKAWEACVKNFKTVGKYAAGKGIRFAVEPVNRYESSFMNTADDAVKLIKEIDNKSVGVLLDIYHMNIEEKSPVGAVMKTGDLLYHLHVPEHDRGTPGTGHTDWKGIAGAIKEISFDGALVIESCDPKIGSPLAEMGAIWRTYDYGQEELATKGYEFIKNTFR